MELGNVTVRILGCTDTLFEQMEGVCHIKTLANFSIVQSLTGSYEVQLDDGDVYSTGAGGMFLAPPQCVQKITHHMDPESGTMHARWVFFDVELNDASSAELWYDFPVIPERKSLERLSAALDSIISAEHPCDRMCAAYRMVKELLEIARPKEARYTEEVLQVAEYIKTHYTERITVADLAKLAHVSQSNLYALFRKQFRSSPVAYLNHYRLTVASKMLLSTEEPVERVARAVGIEDVHYFSKLFKRKYCMTPTAYRKNIVL